MDGFLNVNKPSGWTSHDVVAHLRNLLGTEFKQGGDRFEICPQSRPSRLKIGHTGTLDPDATGVLPICVGKATKLARFLTETDKEYRAVMRLGETTDTQDASGKILTRRPVGLLTEERIRVALIPFRGEIRQIPPMYSAVKVGGQPLYKAARAGREVDRASRTVTILRLELLGIHENDVTLTVACSKGTYVRTLCADIGERLGTGAHLVALERTRSGPFRIEEAMTIPDLEEAVRSGRVRERLLPPGRVLKDFPSVSVTADGARHVLNGATIGLKGVARWPKEFETGQHVLVYNTAGDLIALAEALVGRREAPVGAPNGDRKTGVFKVERVLV